MRKARFLALGCVSVGLSMLMSVSAHSAPSAEDARLLRQPDLSASHIAFVHGGELSVVERQGGDYFPWAWRQQKAGPLIGARTWGGLVKSSVHYSLVDGGGLTAPDNAVFDPIHGEWVGENRGIAPDIEVFDEALAVSEGRDLQLEKGVQVLMDRLPEQPRSAIESPPFPRPSVAPGDSP